jgi:cell division protein FtsW (lipid II flippase)
LWLMVIALSLLVLVLIPSVGTEINEARRWLHIPLGPVSVSFQPSELAKWTMVLFLAGACAELGDSIKRFWTRFLPLCALIAVVCGLIITQDLGTTVFIGLMSLLMLVIAGARWWHVLMPLPFGVAGFVAVLYYSPHRLDRLLAFLYPERYSESVAYQATQSLIAIGSGGVFGKGWLAASQSQLNFLPLNHTDFIFAVLAEQWGFLGCLVVLLVYFYVITKGFQIAGDCTDPFAALLAVGISAMLAIQVLVNIAMVLGMMPVVGIPLPLLSYGGSSLLVTMVSLGLLLNIRMRRFMY